MSNVAPQYQPDVLDAEPVEPRNPGDSRLDEFPWLPFTLTVDVPVVRFTIADLLALKTGSIVETACHYTSDVPLRVNQMLVGWSEFEVVGDKLAVRMTDQA